MVVLGPGGEDTGVAMWQFWGRIRGLLCGSFGAGGEDTDEDTGVAMCDARIMLAPWRWEVCGQGASCLLIGDSRILVGRSALRPAFGRS